MATSVEKKHQAARAVAWRLKSELWKNGLFFGFITLQQALACHLRIATSTQCPALVRIAPTADRRQ